MNRERFSQRRGVSIRETEIKIRDDAPQHVREAIVQIAKEAGLRPSDLRRVICRVLRVAPSDNNWSEYPNIDYEVNELISSCEWYRVYDIVEALMEYLGDRGGEEDFQREINQFFRESGVGWQLIDGAVEIRGPEHFEAALDSVAAESSVAGAETAQREFHEALLDLSRRPDPDVTGAVQHAMAGLECVARELVGDPRATLGEILRRYPGRIPKPLDTAIEKLWGFASERARHVREGGAVEKGEAALVVSVAAAAATYVLGSMGSNDR